MTDPYQTPTTFDSSAVFESDTFAPLASPWMRLLAQIIDMVILCFILIPLLGVYIYYNQELLENGDNNTVFGVVTGVVSIVAWLLINWAPLGNGQTWGKKILKLQIRMRSGAVAERMHIYIRRFLPMQLVSLIPCIGGIAALVDVLLIFRTDRNTLHDDIANTQVVQLP